MPCLYGHTSDMAIFVYPKGDTLYNPIVERVIRCLTEDLALPHGSALVATLLSAVVVGLLLHELPVGIVALPPVPGLWPCMMG